MVGAGLVLCRRNPSLAEWVSSPARASVTSRGAVGDSGLLCWQVSRTFTDAVVRCQKTPADNGSVTLSSESRGLRGWPHQTRNGAQDVGRFPAEPRVSPRQPILTAVFLEVTGHLLCAALSQRRPNPDPEGLCRAGRCSFRDTGVPRRSGWRAPRFRSLEERGSLQGVAAGDRKAWAPEPRFQKGTAFSHVVRHRLM